MTRPLIVEVVQRLAPGGIEVLVLDMKRALYPECEVHVVSLEGTRDSITSHWPHTKILDDHLHALDKPPGREWRTVSRLHRLLRRLAPAGVHTHHIGPLIYGGIAARLAGIRRLVHTEHDAWHLDTPRQRTLLRTAMGWLRPQLVAVSSGVAGEIAKALPSLRPQIIANGVDTLRFSPGDKHAARLSLGLPVDGALIGTAGRLEAVKGHDLLFDAFGRLPDNVMLAVAGIGSRRSELEALAISAGFGDRVRFLGHVNDMPSFYRAIDVFALPSQAEGLPLALLEAQACAVPAVVTNVGGMGEVLAPGTSVGVPAGNSHLFADALREHIERHPRPDPRPFILDNFDLRNLVSSYRALLAP